MGGDIMNNIPTNYTKTIQELSTACITLEGEGNFSHWKELNHFNVQPLRIRVNILKAHFDSLAGSQVLSLLTDRRETILKAFESRLFPGGGETARELILELADIEIELSRL